MVNLRFDLLFGLLFDERSDEVSCGLNELFAESPSGDSQDGFASSNGFLLPIRLSFSTSCSTSCLRVTHRTSQRDLDWSGRDL